MYTQMGPMPMNKTDGQQNILISTLIVLNTISQWKSIFSTYAWDLIFNGITNKGTVIIFKILMNKAGLYC